MGWVQLGFDIDGEDSGDYSGYSVSLSSDGNFIAIGAPYNGVDAFGHVRIFQNKNGRWIQVGSDINGEVIGDGSGWSVCLSEDGNFIAVGAPYNSEKGTNVGAVRVYSNQNGIWRKVGSDIYGENISDNFGKSVSLSSDGSLVAIGADDHDENRGVVQIYRNESGNWSQIGLDIDGEEVWNWFGYSVSLSSDGSFLAIGAPRAGRGGYVKIFQNINDQWTQVGSDINGEAFGDRSGESVSLSRDGSIVAIGSIHNRFNGTYSGHVRVFKNSNGEWTQVGSDIDGLNVDDYSGWSVSLSEDGNFLAIGAPENNKTLPLSDQKGYVRIFRNINNNWVQIGEDIQGEFAYDHAGFSVDISDGGIVAIGAPYNDGNGIESGHVRIFKFISEDIIGTSSNDSLLGTTWIDSITGGEGDDIIDGGTGSDTSIYSGEFSNYSFIRTTSSIQVADQRNGTNDGKDTLSNIEYLQFSDLTVPIEDVQGESQLKMVSGQKEKLTIIRDYDGNLHGFLDNAPAEVITGYKYQGKLDVNNDGTTEAIFTNKESGRWVTAALDPITGTTDYSKHGEGGTTRIVGIYEDPLVKAGLVEKDSDLDGSRTFINDLKLDNLILKTVGDYDGDGFQEVYWSKVDNTAYLRAVMHADGNIQYANYQNLDQMTDYLTGHGFADTVALIA